MNMDWIKASRIVFLLSLMSCIQANPVSKSLEHESKPTPVSNTQISNTDIQKESSHNAISNNDNNNFANNANNEDNDNKKNDASSNNDQIMADTSNLLKTEPIFQQGQGQNENNIMTDSLPFLESLSPPFFKATNPNEAGSSPDGGVSKEFTRKVLHAFFAELKNRPDLVDDILRRETYKLLMNIAQDGSDFDSLTPEVDLAQELVPESVLHPEDTNTNDDTANVIPKMNVDVPVVEKEVSKKATKDENTVKTENVLKSSDIPQGESRMPSQAAKLQAALARELTNIGQSSLTPKADTANTNGDGSTATEQLLIDPYYYYVYYDENQDSNSKSPSKNGNAQPTPISDNSNSKTDKSTQNTAEDTISIVNQLAAINTSPPEEKSHVVNVNKIGPIMKSAIARDMEKQLSKSKLLALNDAVIDNHNHRVWPEADVQVGSRELADSGANDKKPSEEEVELTNLSE